MKNAKTSRMPAILPRGTGEVASVCEPEGAGSRANPHHRLRPPPSPAMRGRIETRVTEYLA